MLRHPYRAFGAKRCDGYVCAGAPGSQAIIKILGSSCPRAERRLDSLPPVPSLLKNGMEDAQSSIIREDFCLSQDPTSSEKSKLSGRISNNCRVAICRILTQSWGSTCVEPIPRLWPVFCSAQRTGACRPQLRFGSSRGGRALLQRPAN